jgi:hypothetical protein
MENGVGYCAKQKDRLERQLTSNALYFCRDLTRGRQEQNFVSVGSDNVSDLLQSA